MNIFLGIDTSNYTTSIAVVNYNQGVICDFRQLLEVKKGCRGIRQSEAFFRHSQNLTHIWSEIVKKTDLEKIKAIGVSTTPRRVENSYMPVFTAGMHFAKNIGNALGVPVYEFSHQEGHIKSAEFDLLSSEREQLDFKDNHFIVFHLSGGTSEVLEVMRNHNFQKNKVPYICKIIGGSKDISFGQLLDRIGVAMGCEFPAGRYIDKSALAYECKPGKASFSEKVNKLLKPIETHKKIYKNSSFVNISGFETSIQRLLSELDKLEKEFAVNREGELPKKEIYNYIAYIVLDEISDTLEKFINVIQNSYKNMNIILIGGVSESCFIRNRILQKCSNVFFGKNGRDNGIGVALLGGELWKLNP